MLRKIDYALEYAAKGWKVLALAAGTKIPARHVLQEHGVKDATANPIHIRQIWDDIPDANVGIATGSASGITVLDLDSEEAKNEMANISSAAPPITYGVKTPRGWHLYFKYDKAVEQSAGRVPKVDIRNDGGYVVAAGSVVNDVLYTVMSNEAVKEWDFPAIFKSQNGVVPQAKKWVSALLADGVSEGQRNSETFRLACHYRQLGHNDDELATLVHSFNEGKNQPPLPYNEVEAIIQSALRFEAGKQIEYVGPMIDPPMIEAQTDRRSTFYWAATGIRVELSRIEHYGSRAYCKLKVHTSDEGLIYGPVSYSLYDERSRRDVRQTLRERHPLADWTGILHHIAQVVDTHSERQEDVIDLAAHVPTRDSAYLLYPIVRENQATVLYADGGTGKSTFALALAASAATGGALIPGINPTGNQPTKTLYLDWEADSDDASEMLQEIARGSAITIPTGMISYKNMSGSFIDHVDSLVAEIVERKVGFIIVDSLVASAGGDVTDAEAARLYFNAVRSLRVASVGITHTNKEGKLYGNRFFWNLARQVFRLSSVQEAETDPALGLYHEKANRSQLVAPMAWNVTYSKPVGELSEYIKPSIKYETADIQSIPELAKNTGLRDRLIGLLRNGNLSVDEMSEATDIADTAILAILHRFPAVFRRREGIDNEWELCDE